jgi:hypothetical protein
MIGAAGLYIGKAVHDVVQSIRGKSNGASATTLGAIHKQIRSHADATDAAHAGIAEALRYQTDATRDLRDSTKTLAEQVRIQAEKLTEVRVEVVRLETKLRRES